jgi:hypothetical protein
MNDWLPDGVPEDFFDWPLVHVEPRWEREDNLHHHVNARGPLAYETLWAQDGRDIEIIEWRDGIKTRHWRRDPIDGVRPGAYLWRAVTPEEETP